MKPRADYCGSGKAQRGGDGKVSTTIILRHWRHFLRFLIGGPPTPIPPTCLPLHLLEQFSTSTNSTVPDPLRHTCKRSILHLLRIALKCMGLVRPGCTFINALAFRQRLFRFDIGNWKKRWWSFHYSFCHPGAPLNSGVTR